MDLRFATGSFDGCRAERVLMHVPDPIRALSEMLRVTKPGGRVSVFDFDWDTFVIDSPHSDTTRRVVSSFSDSIRNGWIGRQLRLFASYDLSSRFDFEPGITGYKSLRLMMEGVY